MHEISDFRSDKVARPTPGMLEAMTHARWGNGIGEEGSSVHELEKLACELTGKEASLFVISGTMANELAVKAMTSPGDQIILDDQSHVFAVESGYAATLSGVQTRALPAPDGMLDLAALDRTFAARFGRTSLVLTENTHNMLGGKVVPLDYMRELHALAHRHGAQVYLDGARILNASAKTGVPVADYAACADSLMFCLSKGLCAPAGSMLCGSADFVRRAADFRKVFGGALKQPGPLAECGIVALTEMVDRLVEDHSNGARLAQGLCLLPEAAQHLEVETPETNMVFFTLRHASPEIFQKGLAERKVLALHMGLGRFRFVTHHDVDAEDVGRAVAVIGEVLRGL